ncbi:MAG: LytTR family DNA-binding domain-containing protein [Steroidobacteraceae bacterium]
MRRTLSELERDLGDEQFIRIHRSIIVNLDRIHGLELQDGGEYEVVLKSRSGCSIAWVRDRTRPVER